jgi:hypothetical protein
MQSPRIELVFGLWQCDKENHGWREGPAADRAWLEFRSVEGLHPPGIFNSNEKRILPSAAIRKRIHFGDWPVYCCFSARIGNHAPTGDSDEATSFPKGSRMAGGEFRIEKGPSCRINRKVLLTGRRSSALRHYCASSVRERCEL